MKYSTKSISLLTLLITAMILTVLMTWLVRSETGSRWALNQAIGLSPVTIEASGISGTLTEEINIENLYIKLPTAEIRAVDIELNLHLTSLLTATVDIETLKATELSVDILEDESSEILNDNQEVVAEENLEDDELFWLDFPVHINISSGQLDKLRIDVAEFDEVKLNGSIGHNNLKIVTLETEVNGVKVVANGELIGPDPGRLVLTANWEMPTENLSGSGDFSGDIETLDFTHVINLPESVNFNGTIHNLFTEPTLTGLADWTSIRLPGQEALISSKGNFTVHSDFLSIHLKGSNTLLLEGLLEDMPENWPENMNETPMQLEANADLQRLSIDSYSLQTLDGSITGSGQINYHDDLQGELQINGSKIDINYFNPELQGLVEFNSSLQIKSASSFIIDVDTVTAQVNRRDFTGQFNGDGRATWSDGKLTAINTRINAGKNHLTTDIKLDKQITGSVKTNAPELALIWPDLKGALQSVVTLGGSREHPQLHVTADASSVSLGTHSLKTFALNGELQSDSKLTGKLVATGLVADQQPIGKLDIAIKGSLTEHKSILQLAGDVVDIQLHTRGSWQNGNLAQTFEYGQIQPDGLASWQLKQNPKLQLSAESGNVSVHCWQQQEATICFDSSNWGPNTLHSKIIIDGFTLNTLNPLLAEGYSVDGSVDADIKIEQNNSAGLQGEIHWRQSRTLLKYSDDIDKIQTVIDEINIDLLSDEKHTDLVAKLTGEQGLTMTATAKVSGPLVEGSSIIAGAKGRLPSIALLRPLLQRVANPGEVKGDLTVDLSVAGTLGDPAFTGGAVLRDGSLQLLGPGVTLSDINITAKSKDSDKLMLTGRLRSGEGTADIDGDIFITRSATEKTGFLANVHVQGQNLASVRVPDLSLDSSPDLNLRISKDVFDISGTITIPRATAQIRGLPKNAIPRSEDVVIHTPDRADKKLSDSTTNETIVTGEVEVLLGDQVQFIGFGLTSRLEGGLKLTQRRGSFLSTNGTVRVRDGFLTGYGRELRVDRGELTFTGPLDDPLINIQVSRESIYEGRQYIIGLRLTGSAQHVNTEPFSRPSMSENDVLTFLLLDRPASSGDDASGAALALGLQQFVPLEGGRFGLDEVSFETNDANEAAMVAGKRINDRLYVRYVFGTMGEAGSFRIRYRLGRGFSLESTTGSQQSLDLIYLYER